MKIIEKLTDMMEEEMEDAENYIGCAMKWKDDDEVLSKMFHELSADELKHALMIHDNANRIIAEYKQKGNTVPENMQAIYDYLHEKHMERFSDIKLKQTLYR